MTRSTASKGRSETVKSKNIFSVEHRISVGCRWARNHHQSGILWLTGLSGSGKTTLALALEQRLHREGYQVYVLDGDNIRGGLNRDLGFSPEERTENIRRIGETASLFADAGLIVITAFISPYREDRERARTICPGIFHEVYVKAGLETCEARDPKGLYRMARSGDIAEFTGISAPYEPPENPDLVIETDHRSEDECLAQFLGYTKRSFALTDDLVGVA